MKNQYMLFQSSDKPDIYINPKKIIALQYIDRETAVLFIEGMEPQDLPYMTNKDNINKLVGGASESLWEVVNYD